MRGLRIHQPCQSRARVLVLGLQNRFNPTLGRVERNDAIASTSESCLRSAGAEALILFVERCALSPPKKIDPDQLSIRIGEWFEASATGRLSVLTVAFVIVGAFAAKCLGWW